MSGIVYHVLPETTYDWSTLSTTQTVVHDVARAVDVSAYRDAALIVRVHRFSANSLTATKLQVDVFPEAPTMEDPADFLIGSAVASTGSILANAALPYLYEQNLITPFGAWLRIRLTLTQGDNSPPTAKSNATISIDIVAKS